MVETFLTATIFSEFILPFLLVFVLIFAILEKTKLFGEEKKQINALAALFIGLIFIAFPGPRDVVALLMPLLAVALVIMLVFMLLWGFAGGGVEKGLNKGLKITFGILISLFVVISVLWATGYLSSITDLFSSGGFAESFWTNFLILALIGGAVIAVLATKSKSKP